MIESVVHSYQLQKGLKHVIANKGSAGVDGVRVSELREKFAQNKTQLIKEIRHGEVSNSTHFRD
jgi:hypothetical protein